MSLTTWFKDYVYIPLGGSRRSEGRTAFNLMLVFLISGAWHGASFNFMIWGLLNGLYLIIERYFLNARYEKLADRYPHSGGVALFRTAFTFVLISFSWIFFRAATLPDALYIIKAMIGDVSYIRFFELGLPVPEFWIAILSIVILMGSEFFMHYRPVDHHKRKEPFLAKVSACYVLIFIIIILGVYGDYDKAQFIYFAF